MPPLPKSHAEVQLPPPLSLTDDGEEFVLLNDGDINKIFVFGSVEMLWELCQAEYVFMDGTFKTKPLLFFQTYILATVKAGFCIPLVYCLLPDKTGATYQSLFQLITNKCNELNFQCDPSNIIIDFEIAVIRSVWHHYRCAVLHGCFFHFQQSLWWKVQELGLVVSYKNDLAIKRWVRQTGALAFLPVDEVGLGWQFFLVPNVLNVSLQPYINYFQLTWVGTDNNPIIFDWSLECFINCTLNQ